MKKPAEFFDVDRLLDAPIESMDQEPDTAVLEHDSEVYTAVESGFAEDRTEVTGSTASSGELWPRPDDEDGFDPRALIGRNLSGYRIESVLSSGAFAHVYRGRRIEDSKPCAIKLMRPEAAVSPKLRKRMLREAEALSKLRHPNLPSIFEIGITGTDLPFLVLQLIEGTTLKDIIACEAPLAADRAARIALNIARGLEAVHTRGIVHRDLKPSNIILVRDPEERAILLDFGLVSAMDEESSRLTARREVLGTPIYMSPEQIESAYSVTGASDLYALGVIIFVMLTGRAPFVAQSSTDIFEAHRYRKPPEIDEFDGLGPLVQALLSKSPDERPSLEALLPTLERIVKTSRPRPRVWGTQGPPTVKAEEPEPSMLLTPPVPEATKTAALPPGAPTVIRVERKTLAGRAVAVTAGALLVLGTLVYRMAGSSPVSPPPSPDGAKLEPLAVASPTHTTPTAVIDEPSPASPSPAAAPEPRAPLRAKTHPSNPAHRLAKARGVVRRALAERSLVNADLGLLGLEDELGEYRAAAAAHDGPRALEAARELARRVRAVEIDRAFVAKKLDRFRRQLARSGLSLDRVKVLEVRYIELRKSLPERPPSELNAQAQSLFDELRKASL